MEGLAQPNFKGLQRLLDKQPPNADGWAFARGQALLIAETANLLMLRPPQSEGRDVWMERAADVRATATRLARSTASRDYAQARLTFNTLAAMCNRCHQTFRVPTRVEGLASPVENRGKAPVP
jgi:hypothetical protein